MATHIFHIRCFLLAILSCTATLLAGLPSQMPFPLNVEEMLKMAAEITHEKYPEADTALVDDSEYIQYEPSGTYVVWDDMAYKILTEKGKAQLKTQSIHYNKSYGTAAFEFIRIHKPDGTCIDLPLDKLTREMVDPSQMNSNIYNPNDKVVTANLPDLEIGDIIRYRTRHEVTKPRCPNTFSDWFILESDDFIRRYTVVVDAPAQLPLKKIALRNPVGKTVASTTETLPTGHTRHRWTAENVPVMHPEPKMPSFSTVAQRVMVSTIDSWNDVSKWYWKLCQPHLTTTPEMQAKVKELTKDLTRQQDVINAIFRFVSQEIRYMGITIENDAPGYEPHDVALTFTNRHGVCRDKAALLAAMLDLAGIHAFPVLIKAGDKMDPEIPVPFFNHAITAACAPDGSYILMDSTDENTRDLFPSYLADKSFLVARKDGESLQTSPFSPAKDNRVTITTTGAIGEDGALHASAHLDFTGINDNAYRGSFAEMSPDERKEFIQRVLKNRFAGAQLVKLKITPENALETSIPLTIDIEFQCPDIFIANHSYALLAPPSLSGAFGMNNFILGATALDKRNYPFKTRYACGVDETLTLTLAPRWGTPESIPDYTQIDDECLRWTRTLTQNGAQLAIKTTSELKAIEYSPSQYLVIKKHLQTMEENNARKLIFKCKNKQRPAEATASDIEVLEDTTSFNLQSANEWIATTARKYKILTYKGKKEHAELAFSYFPNRESVAVELARVTNTIKNADGQDSDTVQEVSEKEKNIMDAPWVARAPRYPAAKKLVVSLPGVEIGSVVEYKVVRTTRSPFPFAHQETFRDINTAVNRRIVTVNAPVNVKLATALFQNGLFADAFKTHQNNIAETAVTENNRIIWTWTAQQQPPVPDESAMPALEVFTPSVFVSAGNWPEITNAIKNALETKAISGTRVKAVAQKIAELPQEQRLQAVNTFIARNIAIAGPHYQSLPLDALSTPDTTITEGYGHDADAAIAAYALLKELGYTPEFILFCGWSQRNDLLRFYEASPNASLFGGIRVRVRQGDKTFWFNDQNQYANIETTTLDHHRAMTLDGQMFTVTSPAALTDKEQAHFDITLQDDGSADVTYTRTITGKSFASHRRTFAELTPEYRRRLHLQLLQQLSTKATATSNLLVQTDAYPASLSFSCHIPQFAIKDGAYMYLPLPVKSFMNLPPKVLENRQTPMASTAFHSAEKSVTLHLPDAFPKLLMAPKPMEWLSPRQDGHNTTYKVTSQQEQNTLTIVYSAELVPELIFPPDFEQYRNAQKIISHPSMNTVMLGK